MNLVPFERVSTIREMRSRHGMTELAGLLVQDLEISAEDLVHLSHLFHPAQPCPLSSDEAATTVAADLFLQTGPSPADVRLHLHLSPETKHGPLTLLRSHDLRAIIDDFIQNPTQITFSIDALEQDLDWLPLLIGYGGLSRGRMPRPEFFGNILRRQGAKGLSSVIAAQNRLTINAAKAFRLGSVSQIDMAKRADLVGFPAEILSEDGDFSGAVPSFLMLNGAVVYTNGTVEAQRTPGVWFFAPEMKAR
jgi:hypothetical protein